MKWTNSRSSYPIRDRSGAEIALVICIFACPGDGGDASGTNVTTTGFTSTSTDTVPTGSNGDTSTSDDTTMDPTITATDTDATGGLLPCPPEGPLGEFDPFLDPEEPSIAFPELCPSEDFPRINSPEVAWPSGDFSFKVRILRPKSGISEWGPASNYL